MTSLVSVSGLGAVSAAGVGVTPLWDSIMRGQSHIRRIQSFDANPFPTKIAAEVEPFELANYISPKLLKRTGRATHLALIATLEALADSKLNLSTVNLERVAVVVGVSSPQLDIGELSYSYLLEGGLNRLPPSYLGAFFPNATTGAISALFNILGPSLTISTGCSAGSNAIGQAFGMIQEGKVDCAIVVGADSVITPFGLASFCALRNMSTDNDFPMTSCRPFDIRRTGFVLGEGAAAIILESIESTKNRQKVPYCYLSGYGCTSSADDSVNTDVYNPSLSRAITIALDQAELLPASIDAINAHGCGSRIFDRYEALNIQLVFGPPHLSPPVFSIKPIIGHTLAAAGPIQTVATALALRQKLISPMINLEKPDPECPINPLTENALPLTSTSNILINDCGYGGNNVALVLRGIDSI